MPRKKKRTHVRVDESVANNPNAPKIPKSFVFKSGHVGKSVEALVRDMRKVMEPHTAIRLKERKSNRLKDFVAIAGQLGVTQFLIFTRTDTGTNFRLTKTPRGPTLCFRVLKYSLIRDVLTTQINPKSFGSEFHTSPLLVLNNFGGEEDKMKLMTTMFQSMFPSINVNKIQLAEARRVVLFNYNSDTKIIDFRHYSIGVKPIGISKSIRRIINSNIPDLNQYHDISEFVLREGHMSESEAESGVEATVTLPQDFIGKINKKSDQRAIKLTEIGPRMELQLVKIQSGLCDGEVLFHEFNQKTPEEIKKIERERQQKKQEAALRRKEQEKNVERKKAEKEAHRLATSDGAILESDDDEDENDEDDDDDDDDDDENDEEEEQQQSSTDEMDFDIES
ncbi:Brix domain-containing protein [Glomus cerebriforme]|uniref:Brix domain-containing protein n=1 Tax=Glomus cerebriforme TaxID=658196 RepID=A0A397T5Y3_9GLOM|nr:Brix domain-containing protein [Glomus cerebriforme]